MGFFKKIFKGVKKVFKKIGRGIKKVVGKVGKFMNKIPLVGQVALAFVGGPILSSIFKGIGGIATTALGKMGTFGAKILQGAQYISSKATAFASAVNNSGVGRAFKTITDGVSSFLIENGFKGNLKRLGLPDSYVQHGSRSQILSHLSLDDSGIKTKVLELIDEVKEFR